MVTFWIIAVLMMLAAVVLLLPPLLLDKKRSSQDMKGLNVSIFRQRMQELQSEKDDGLIEADQYDKACAELERSLLNDMDADAEHSVIIKEQGTGSRRITLAAVAVLLPAMAIPLYLHYGSLDLIDAKPLEQKISAGKNSMREAVSMLEQRLQQEPGNIEGWVLLAKSYVVLGRLDDAVSAYDKAYKLNPQDPDVMVDYAEMMARANNGDISGEPMRMLRMALAADPNHPKALWISGIVSYNDKDYATAIQHWKQLQSTLEANSQDAAFVQNKIDQARAKLAGGEDALPPDQSRSGSTDRPVAPQPRVTAGVKVRVSLHESLAAKVKPTDTVFIFAQAVNGPRMPMAALRVQVKELPLTTLLDDSMAMGPMARISSAKEVNISARISLSGNTSASSGDLQGSVGPVRVGDQEPVNIVIDQVIP